MAEGDIYDNEWNRCCNGEQWQECEEPNPSRDGHVDVSRFITLSLSERIGNLNGVLEPALDPGRSQPTKG